VIESISSFLASLKAVTPQVLIGVAVFYGVLLFSSWRFVAALGLDGFVDTNRVYIGVGFIGSICILASQFLWWLKGLVVCSTFHDSACAWQVQGDA